MALTFGHFPEKKGEWVQVHSMNQTERRLQNLFPNASVRMCPNPDRCVP